MIAASFKPNRGVLEILMRFLFAVALCLCTITAFAATDSNPLTQQLIARSQSVLQAQKAKNADALKALLTDDFVAVGSEGKMHDKAESVDEARDSKLSEYSTYEASVIMIDDGAAIVTYDAIISATEGDGALVPRYQHLSDLWVKRGDQWLLKFQQATPMRHID
jgi:uncharacterized protein (TIGR02246 family)